MKSASMSNPAMKRENVSASANVLMCKQWWKVCWMYGDQEKYYRQLYGKKAENGKKFESVNGKEVNPPLERNGLHGRHFFNDVGVEGRTEGRIQLPLTRASNSSPGSNSLELHDNDEMSLLESKRQT
ncbi:hypothetical protein HHI36_000304 [Cryptolaemus montrouzieri]|uniref:Protein prickle n=1 Tax=Cryptolaemus montrouzieri TaxID=559131 RepID=A0ABD2P4L3_9CUCU